MPVRGEVAHRSSSNNATPSLANNPARCSPPRTFAPIHGDTPDPTPPPPQNPVLQRMPHCAASRKTFTSPSPLHDERTHAHNVDVAELTLSMIEAHNNGNPMEEINLPLHKEKEVANVRSERYQEVVEQRNQLVRLLSEFRTRGNAALCRLFDMLKSEQSRSEELAAMVDGLQLENARLRLLVVHHPQHGSSSSNFSEELAMQQQQPPTVRERKLQEQVDAQKKVLQQLSGLMQEADAEVIALRGELHDARQQYNNLRHQCSNNAQPWSPSSQS